MTEEWLTHDARVDEEHARLRETLRALRAVVLHCREPALLAEATDVVRARLKVHFHDEEVAAETDPEAAEILREDHRALLRMVDRLRMLTAASHAERKVAMAELFAALEKHEREVDVPVFRLLKPTAA
ncbi:MAG: hypothetical protein AB1918_18615 [Pseudomonadota bacterium]